MTPHADAIPAALRDLGYVLVEAGTGDMDTFNRACLLLRTTGTPETLDVAERLSELGDRVYAAVYSEPSDV